MLINIDIIHSYVENLEKICKLFLETKIEQKKYYDAIGMNRLTFARKIRQRTFSPDEFLKLAEEVNKSLEILEK